ncbi:hypothetical protein K439DRAFT_1385251 [Ramaria rubella]|nr:hypothetical protein K439DRAFT_1385251 [Ramaria rubella]
MLPTLLRRHPRYTIGLLVGFLILILLGATDHSTLGYPVRFRGLNELGHPSLRAKLEETERGYQAVIARRPELIKKYGGGIVKGIEPFPRHGQMYTLWDFFLPAFTCPHKVERIGTLGDGGKYVCGLERMAKKKHCVIYSFGVNGESSFEATILERVHGCQLYGYDFSVNSFGPEINNVPGLKSRSHFWPWGLSGKDAHGPNNNPKLYTLETLMKMNGHNFIDILKIDIEGAEFDALTSLINHYLSMTPPQPLPIGQLQLEVHAAGDVWGNDMSKLLKWWEKLEEAGLRPFWTEPNLVYLNLYRGNAPVYSEYSFINIRGEHELLSDVADD